LTIICIVLSYRQQRQVKLFKTDRIGISHIFGEHQSIKVNNDTVFEFNVKLSESEGFINPGDFFSKFGLSSQSSVEMFISAETMETIYPDLYAGNL